MEASLTTKGPSAHSARLTTAAESFSNAVAALLVAIANVDAELVRPTLVLLAEAGPTSPTPMHSIALRELVESESEAPFKLGLALDLVAKVLRNAAVLDTVRRAVGAWLNSVARDREAGARCEGRDAVDAALARRRRSAGQAVAR